MRETEKHSAHFIVQEWVFHTTLGNAPSAKTLPFSDHGGLYYQVSGGTEPKYNCRLYVLPRLVGDIRLQPQTTRVESKG